MVILENKINLNKFISNFFAYPIEFRTGCQKIKKSYR